MVLSRNSFIIPPMKLTEDSRFAIRSSFPGTGDGLFAVKKIHKGDFILEYTGERISSVDAEAMVDARYLFEINDTWTINGPVPANVAGYINHGCDPNCEAEIDESDRIMIHAIKDIESGEELSFDYGKEYFDEFLKPHGCKCASCIKGLTKNREVIPQ